MSDVIDIQARRKTLLDWGYRGAFGENECCCRVANVTPSVCCDAEMGDYYGLSQFGEVGILRYGTQFFEIFAEVVRETNANTPRIQCIGNGFLVINAYVPFPGNTSMIAKQSLYYRGTLIHDSVFENIRSAGISSAGNYARASVTDATFSISDYLFWKEPYLNDEGERELGPQIHASSTWNANGDFVFLRTAPHGVPSDFMSLFFRGKLIREFPLDTTNRTRIGQNNPRETAGGVLLFTVPVPSPNSMPRATVIVLGKEGEEIASLEVTGNSPGSTALWIHNLTTFGDHPSSTTWGGPAAELVLPPPPIIAIHDVNRVWHVFENGALLCTGTGEGVISGTKEICTNCADDTGTCSCWEATDQWEFAFWDRIGENFGQWNFEGRLVITDEHGAMRARMETSTGGFNQAIAVEGKPISIWNNNFIVGGGGSEILISSGDEDNESEVILRVGSFLLCNNTLFTVTVSGISNQNSISYRVLESGDLERLYWDTLSCCGKMLIATVRSGSIITEVALIDPTGESIFVDEIADHNQMVSRYTGGKVLAHTHVTDDFPSNYRRIVNVACFPHCDIIAGPFGILTLSGQEINQDLIVLPWNGGLSIDCSCGDFFIYAGYWEGADKDALNPASGTIVWQRGYGRVILPDNIQSPITGSIPPNIVDNEGYYIWSCCSGSWHWRVWNQNPPIDFYVYDSTFGLMLFDIRTLERIDPLITV